MRCRSEQRPAGALAGRQPVHVQDGRQDIEDRYHLLMPTVLARPDPEATVRMVPAALHLIDAVEEVVIVDEIDRPSSRNQDAAARLHEGVHLVAEIERLRLGRIEADHGPSIERQTGEPLLRRGGLSLVGEMREVLVRHHRQHRLR